MRGKLKETADEYHEQFAARINKRWRREPPVAEALKAPQLFALHDRWFNPE